MVQLPLVIPLVGALLLAYLGPASSDAVWYRVLALLPPFAPILMPVRIALGSVAFWEQALAVLLMAGTIAAVIAGTVRVYSAALVQGGPRIGWRTALRRAG
jgi:ABC-2 type transport system permease protein